MQIQLNDIFETEFDVISSGHSDGSYNMKFDEDRIHSIIKGESKAMFRLYGWKPAAVSLGFNQKESEINQEQCSKFGIDIVRRPTGGRAVLHYDELTYSIALKVPQGKTSHDIYRDIHLFFNECFSSIGINGLEFEKSQANFRDFYTKQDLSVSCFASTARYEINFQGRKVIGSAQRLFGDVLLQHGSILLNTKHLLLADLVNTDSEERKSKLREYIRTHSADLSEAANREISYEEAATAVLDKIPQRHLML